MKSINTLVVLSSLITSITSQSSSISASHSSVSSSTSTISSATSTNSASSSLPSSVNGSNDGTNPLIPTTISTNCQSFLESLNADVALSACTTPILSTLSLFTPSSLLGAAGGGGNQFTGTTSEINSTLSSLCSTSSNGTSTSTSCSSNQIRENLNYFSGNCSTELKNGEETVLGMYDILYLIIPLTQSVCSLDSIGGYCLKDIATGSFPSTTSTSTPLVNSTTIVSTNSTSTGSNSTTTDGNNVTTTQRFVQQLYSLQDYYVGGEYLTPSSLFISVSSTAKQLLRRTISTSNSTITFNSTVSNYTTTNNTVNLNSIEGLLPNTTTFRTSYLPFLFLNPEMTPKVLCNSCTLNILANYVKWETKVPYYIGLSNSPLLGSQGTLWSSLGIQCGGTFLQEIEQRAGLGLGTGNGLSSGATSEKRLGGGLMVVLMGVMGGWWLS